MTWPGTQAAEYAPGKAATFNKRSERRWGCHPAQSGAATQEAKLKQCLPTALGEVYQGGLSTPYMLAGMAKGQSFSPLLSSSLPCLHVDVYLPASLKPALTLSLPLVN